MKMVIIKREDINNMNKLMILKENDSFFVMDEFNGYSKICQYSSKYDNLHIVEVKNDNLKNACKMD